MSYAGHVRAILSLGLPLIGGHVAQMAIGITDTVMLGWYGVAPLAAVTLGHSYFFVFFMLGSGFALAVMPLVSAASARGDEVAIRRSTRMGLWLSLAFALVIMPVMWWSQTILSALGQEPELAADVAQYLRIAGWGLVPALLVMVIKSYLAALERTQVVLWITLMAAVANGIVNYALIFGNWGAPELGLQGAAIASVTTQFISLLAIIAYARRALPHHDLFRRIWRPDWEVLGSVFRLGLPIGLTTVSEVSLFAATAFMMGWIGTVPLAAHGIVITVSGATFMVHLGLSNAATIRAGNAFGRGDRAHMRRGAIAVCALSLVMVALTVAAFLGIPEPIVGLFLEADAPARAEVIALGVTLLAVAALFQLVDGAQVIALGLLRGVQDTTVPMIIAIFAYWAVGLPAAYVLGFTFGFGAVGLWFGLVFGLAGAGIILMLRFWRHSIRTVGRAPA
ncbi:MATE family efflux transporter [Albibacillus kandeliae]|uniref:MATE family efflux transporter n=1 Tax=Albibacillus kandeliae TaxID=2174228 RepID=UPI001E45CA51|nr:MATE family efflux transporter [Albibacillus kandeliae]